MSSTALLADLTLYSVQIALVIAVVLLLQRVLKITEPNVRLRFGHWTLAALLLLPVIGVLRNGLPEAPTTAQSEVILGGPEITTPPTPAASKGWLAIPTLLLALWPIGTLARLIFLAIGCARLRGLVRRAQRVELSEDLKAAEHIRIYRSSELHSPATWGLLRPTLALPDRFFSLTHEQQLLVLRHETAHIERRDWLMVWFEELTRALLWFHPMVWYLLHQLHLDRERAVDQLVVRDTSLTAYAQTLLKLAETQANRTLPRAPALVASMARPSDLEFRIRHLQERHTMSKQQLNQRTKALALGWTAALLISALVFPPPSVSAATFSPWLAVKAPQEPEQAPPNAQATQAIEPGETDETEGQDEDKIHYVTEDITPPVKLSAVPPQYTEEAKKARVQGVAILQVVINEQGNVTKAQVLKGLPMGLSEAALEAVKQWTFEPARENGVPVSVYYNLTINFQLPAPPDRPTFDKEPQIQVKIEPEYTEVAKEARIQGVVILDVLVSRTGSVLGVNVRKGLPLGLSEAATTAVYDWKFLPALKDGEAVEAMMRVNVDFRLPE